MELESIPSLTISVFTRHADECPKRKEPQWRRCTCRKSIYIREAGKTTYISAKTRSWEEAERVAQRERDKRDPVAIELARIAKAEAVKAEAAKAKDKPIDEALKQWLAGMKTQTKSSLDAYRSGVAKINKWAASVGVRTVGDLTPDMLDAWRSSWSPDSENPELRLSLNSQSTLLTRVKAFCKWAAAMEYTHRNPALILKAITTDESQTWPLTVTQFDELLAATYRYDEECRMESSRVGRHLRAIFLVQRWTGLRIGDAVGLPKSALVGNRLTVIVRKKRNRNPNAARIERVLPDVVVDALTSLPLRKEEHPGYFFWSGPKASAEDSLRNKWIGKIERLNEYLDFEGEDGEPLPFRSHMLRDTFAVEMLSAGVPLEKVSKLLTHESVTMTEKYYAKWTKRRNEQLEDEAVAAMRRMGVTVGDA